MLMLSCPPPGRRAGAGSCPGSCRLALAGEVAREAAAERDALLAAAGEKVPRRRARLLPPWLAVYFTLALCLLARLPYQDALRSLAGDGTAGLAVPADDGADRRPAQARGKAAGTAVPARRGGPAAVP